MRSSATILKVQNLNFSFKISSRYVVSLLSFPFLLSFLRLCDYEGRSCTTYDQSSQPSFLIIYRTFLSSINLCNASFFTWSVLNIFFILLRHQISELSLYFRSNFRRVQVSTPYEAMLQEQQFISLLLNSSPICCWKEFFLTNDFASWTLKNTNKSTALPLHPIGLLSSYCRPQTPGRPRGDSKGLRIHIASQHVFYSSQRLVSSVILYYYYYYCYV